MKRIISFVITLALVAGVLGVPVSAHERVYNLWGGSAEQLFKDFHAGLFWVSIYIGGYSGADILKSRDTCVWKNFDMRTTLAFSDDDLSDLPRYVGLVYRMTAPSDDLPEEKVPCIKFFYDVEKQSFVLLSGEGYYYNDEDVLLAEMKTDMKVETSFKEYRTFGLSVISGEIRCFCDEKQIFEYTDPAIGENDVPFILINGGNYIEIYYITVTTPEYMYPCDISDDGKTTLTDVSVLLKHLAKWEGYEDRAADWNDDGEVSLSDATWLMKHIADWYREINIEEP